MEKKWDYSELAHNAKMNGGPEKYLEMIRDNSMREGRREGKAEGKTELLIAEGITLGLGLLGYTGYKIFTSVRDKREKETLEEQKKEVKVAETELLKGIKQALKEEGKSIEEQTDKNEKEEVKNEKSNEESEGKES